MARSILITGLMAAHALAQGQFAIDGWEYAGCVETNAEKYFPSKATLAGPLSPQDCQQECVDWKKSAYVAVGGGCNCGNPNGPKDPQVKIMSNDKCSTLCFEGREDLGFCGGEAFDIITPQRYNLYRRIEVTAEELRKRVDDEECEEEEEDDDSAQACEDCDGNNEPATIIVHACPPEVTNCNDTTTTVHGGSGQHTVNNNGNQHGAIQTQTKTEMATPPAQQPDCSGTDCVVIGGAAELATGSIIFVGMTAALAYCLM
ncbi:hypothetical protein B0T10DRAFT_563581 [Thelonectria olida]|uniref:WSC domain-containing protein n=1 Tax=Thelonectria olida TaxID=1576542 RepID=A0A9P8W0J1_9HYPO|nr:hypothetical protein B0T10DRAFT_563581 [Thelonectria olida]